MRRQVSNELCKMQPRGPEGRALPCPSFPRQGSRGQRGPAEALAFYRQAIAEIESLRSTLSVTQLRTTFLADKRDAYDERSVAYCVRAAEVPRNCSDMLEQIRARVLRERTGRGDAQPRLKDVQQRLPADTALLELWRSGPLVGTLLITGTSATPRMADSLTPETVERLVRLWNEGQSPPGCARRRGGLRAGGQRPRTPARGYPPDRRAGRGSTALPFEALPLSTGGPLAIDRFEVGYVPSAAFVQEQLKTGE